MEMWYILKLLFFSNKERINGFEILGKEINMDFFFLVCIKINFRWIDYLNIR